MSKIFRESELFNNMNDREFDSAMKHIRNGEFFYPRNKIIFTAGDIINSIGLVLTGSVIIESNNLFGSVILLGLVSQGEFFGEVYAILGEPLLVDVKAHEDSKILFLRVDNLPDSCSWSFKLVNNLLGITARKNLYLSQRSFVNANKTIRRKVMSYLNSISLVNDSKSFDIPFDRQQMADYLNIDRSALSKELSSMKREGIIDFRRNHFIINTNEVN